jgi:metal-responsive CopG/Arc/MetJ family transcriptional regulator
MRRSISVRADTYDRLTEYATKTKQTRSGVVESLLREYLGSTAVKADTAQREIFTF